MLEKAFREKEGQGQNHVVATIRRKANKEIRGYEEPGGHVAEQRRRVSFKGTLHSSTCCHVARIQRDDE